MVSCEGETAVVCEEKDERVGEIRYSNAQVSVPALFFSIFFYAPLPTRSYVRACYHDHVKVPPSHVFSCERFFFFFRNYLVSVASAHYIHAAVPLYYTVSASHL